jgi:pentapeptide repeat protein
MSPQVEAAIIAASVGVLTLIATVATQYLGRRATSRDTEKTLDRTFAQQREQLDKTLAEQREQLDRTLTEQRTRTLNERFATAAGQLGGDKPPAVRLAGVYAMAGLADDWKENRQTCVDVLCAHLRMPYYPDPGQDAPEPKRLTYRANREVRHTVIRVITAHLRDDAAVSWQGLNFDFTGVVFDGGDFGGANFSGGTVRFDHAEFSGARFTSTAPSSPAARSTSATSSSPAAMSASAAPSSPAARLASATPHSPAA